MPELQNFLEWGGQASDWLDQIRRASGVRFMAGYRTGIEIALTRNGTTLAPQLVVIAPSRSHQNETSGEAGRVGTLGLVLIGIKDHATLPDFDVQRGDRFAIGTARYEVMVVEAVLDGRVEAWAEAIQ